MKKYFKIYSSCIIVNGIKSSLIYDTERNEFYDLPNDIRDLLRETNKLSLEELQEKYTKDIYIFLEQFINMEVGFYTNEPELFPDIDLSWESPNKVNNAIIELSSKSNFDFSKVVTELNNLGTIGYQIRFLDFIAEKKIRDLLNEFKNSRAVYIEILLPFTEDVDYYFLKKIIEDYPRIILLKIFNSRSFKQLDSDSPNDKKIIFLEKNILSDTSEIILPERFVTEIGFFSEAQNHNLGLNRKVAITKHGEIKNYINHKNSFGIVGENSIGDVIETDSFKKMWFISNDKIETCKNCQYRYTCVSNSDIINEDGKYSKVKMCAFNPNTNSWN